MKGTKTLGTVLVVAVIVFVIPPIISAQDTPGILHNQWFKVKLSAKGYMIDDDQDQTVLGKGAGSLSAYLLFCFDGSSSYTIRTCTQDDENPGQWYKIDNLGAEPQPPIPDLPSPRNSISIDNIYGALYPQIWDFETTPLVLYDGISILSLCPKFYTKITADITNPAKLKTASIVHVSCGLYTKEDMGESGAQYGIGSCTINGPLIPAANVTKKVPQSCQSVCP
jgi:hypothetical protein